MMRSLLVRIFLSFWLMIVITIAAAAGVGFYYAERARSAIERFEVSDAMLEASEALRVEGREGLEDWLKSLKGVTKSLIYVVDGRGRDILGRRMPARVVIALRRFGDERRGSRDRDRGNLRPARPFTQLIGTDGSVYTIFVLPPQGNVARWLEDRSPLTLGTLAFLASAVVSLLLARTISRPVERLRDSAGAIAQGKLDTRVPPSVSQRKDEIGRLGKEFGITARARAADRTDSQRVARIAFTARPIARRPRTGAAQSRGPERV
jgi:two-component system sensor histidine kinase CpxA